MMLRIFLKKQNTEIENNTETGDNDTDFQSTIDSPDNTEVVDNTDSEETTGINEEEKPSLDDYVIEETEGEYVLIKSAVVRSGPSTDFDKLGQLQADIVVEITGVTDNGWFQFEYDSVDGYINQKFFMDKETYDEEVASNESGEENQIEENNTEEHVESTLASQIVAICNEYRVAEGLEPLTEDPELDALAQIRAEEIVVYFEHERPDGSDCFTVMKDYKCTLCGENIAAGQGNPKEVVDAWMDSEGHRANIMNKDFKRIGIGYSAGGEFGAYWAQLFAD